MNNKTKRSDTGSSDAANENTDKMKVTMDEGQPVTDEVLAEGGHGIFVEDA